MIFLTIGFFSIKQSLAGFVTSKVVSELAKKKISLQVNNPDFGLLNYKAKELDFLYYYTFAPINLSLSDLTINPKISNSFFNKGFVGSVSFDAYSGSFEFDGTILNKSIQTHKLLIDKINFSKHPQINFFGISDGLVSIDIQDALLENDNLSIDKFKITIENFSRDFETIIPSQITKLPFSITLPEIKNGFLDLICNIKNQRLNIDFLTIKSNLLDLQIKSIVNFSNKRILKFEQLDGDVRLSTEGLALIGQFLPLISNNYLSVADRNFKFRLKGFNNNLPDLEFIKS